MQAQTLNDGAAEAITNIFSCGKRVEQTYLVACQADATNKGKTR